MSHYTDNTTKMAIKQAIDGLEKCLLNILTQTVKYFVCGFFISLLENHRKWS